MTSFLTIKESINLKHCDKSFNNIVSNTHRFFFVFVFNCLFDIFCVLFGIVKIEQDWHDFHRHGFYETPFFWIIPTIRSLVKSLLFCWICWICCITTLLKCCYVLLFALFLCFYFWFFWNQFETKTQTSVNTALTLTKCLQIN